MAGEIAVHIGLHKTGTTAIQLFLKDNSSFLDAFGFRVSRSGHSVRFPIGHHGVPWALMGFNTEPVLRELVEEIDELEDQTLILSSEEFSRLDRDQIMRLGDLLCARRKPVIILYLRNQVDLVESLYRTEVVHFDQSSPFVEFIARCHERLRLDYERLIADWSDAFGPEALCVRDYAEFRSGDRLIRDFCALLGMAWSPTFLMPPADANHGLSFPAVQAIAYCRREGVDEAAIQQFTNWCRGRYAQGGSFVWLDQAAADRFMAPYVEGNARVMERFFDTSHGLARAPRPKKPLSGDAVWAPILRDFVGDVYRGAPKSGAEGSVTDQTNATTTPVPLQSSPVRPAGLIARLINRFRRP